MGASSQNNQIQDVLVYAAENFLGYLSVSVAESVSTEALSWEGQILGSDYLVWGLNHRRVRLKFKDGSAFDVIIRPGGKVSRILDD